MIMSLCARREPFCFSLSILVIFISTSVWYLKEKAMNKPVQLYKWRSHIVKIASSQVNSLA